MKTNETELKDLLQRLVKEEVETAPEQSSYVANEILTRGLVSDLNAFAGGYNPELGDTHEEELVECILDYSCLGGMITIEIDAPEVPGGELVYYGMTREDSIRIMNEFMKDHLDLCRLTDGKALKFYGCDKEYTIRVVNDEITFNE